MSLSEEFLRFRNELVKELPTPNMLLCCTADRLLILVEEQEKELAHWRWLYGERSESKQTTAPEQTQHSADLLAIAEMAIRWAMTTAKPSLDAAEVVREFLEKKAKDAFAAIKDTKAPLHAQHERSAHEGE